MKPVFGSGTCCLRAPSRPTILLPFFQLMATDSVGLGDLGLTGSLIPYIAR